MGRVLLGRQARAGPSREVHPRARASSPPSTRTSPGRPGRRSRTAPARTTPTPTTGRTSRPSATARAPRPISGARSASSRSSRGSGPSSSRSAGSTTSAGTAPSASGHVHDSALARWTPTPSQKAVGLYFGVVALLFLLQTLAGGALAHYRVESGAFYGIDLARFLPYNLLRTLHLQLAIFWIATAWVAGRPLPRAARRRRRAAGAEGGRARAARGPRGRRLRQPRRRVAGHQRPPRQRSGSGSATRARSTSISAASGSCCWRSGSWAGSSSCTAPCARRSATRSAPSWPSLFLYAAAAIPLFYLPALFFGPRTNFAVIDNWRFWIIHLWVEGFFELFATVLVAVMFVRPGPGHGPDRHARHLPGRHPLPGRRHRRHRAPLVLHRPGHAQHGAGRVLLRAGGRARSPC